VERWFGPITQQGIRRRSFQSVSELVQKIDAYVVSYNLHRSQLVWTATVPTRSSQSFNISVMSLMGQNTGCPLLRRT